MKCGHDFSMLAFCFVWQTCVGVFGRGVLQKGELHCGSQGLHQSFRGKLHLFVYHGSLLIEKRGNNDFF